MQYITDMHVHTANIGSCATAQPEEAVESFIRAGITSVVISNHLTKHSMEICGLNFNEWQKFCDCVMEEYHRAVNAAGDRLNVILGGELRVPDNRDYLIYGLTEEKLRSYYGILDMNIHDAAAMIHESGALIIQAHPFRDGQVITNPSYLDGIEVCNFNYKIDSRNDIARIWAEHYGLIETCGSDYHHVTSAVGGGIVTEKPIRNALELMEVLKNGSYEIKAYRDERSQWVS